MGDAWIKGGRAGGRSGLSGEDKLRSHRNYNEHWIERAVQGLYQSAVEESVPKDMLDIVRRLPLSEPSSEQTMGRQDDPREPPGSPVGSAKPNQPPDAPSPDAMNRARRWRAKAEEVRTAAESMGSESARHTLLRLAHDYDALAESLELLILERPRRDRNAG